MRHDEPLIIIVDDHDEPIGVSTIAKATAEGLTRRIARVIVEDPEGNIPLQKRLENAPVYPGRWDTSAAGHVDEGETYLQAANRELKEEIGLGNIELSEARTYRHTEIFGDLKLDGFHKIYKTVVPSNTKFSLQPEEVSEVKWFGANELKNLIKDSPNIFTDGVKEIIKHNII